MNRETKHPRAPHEDVKQQYDEVQSDGRYEEGMARMALYHRHCQDPVIFRALGDIRGKSLSAQVVKMPFVPTVWASRSEWAMPMASSWR